MLQAERRNKILELLNVSGFVQVSELTDILEVSVETVRRDLEYLEKKEKIKKVHGGAILENFDNLEVFNIRNKEYSKEKEEIANIAIRFISDGQSIAMDSSTTNLAIAKKLKSNFKNLTIVTNSLLIALELSDIENFNIFSTGGKLIPSQYCFIGNIAINNLDNFVIDTSFLSTSGISLSSGITDYNFYDVDIQKKMIDISNKTIILADNSKFDKSALVKVANLNEIDLIITDSNIDEDILNIYKDNGVNIVYN
ncbi:MAG: DeoR/GlpR transcriptional regulator [Tissierellia bacterium]|nr:DeoR/GlpR transcriptional regulator [Tissierellia bacterium]